MLDFEERRKIRNLLFSKLTLLLLLILIFFTARAAYERFTVERQVQRKSQDKQEELEALKERATVLESRVERLKDERGVEEELRNRFDVAKEGEQVVIILDNGEETETDLDELSIPPGTDTEEEESSFFDMFKWW